MVPLRTRHITSLLIGDAGTRGALVEHRGRCHWLRLQVSRPPKPSCKLDVATVALDTTGARFTACRAFSAFRCPNVGKGVGRARVTAVHAAGGCKEPRPTLGAGGLSRQSCHCARGALDALCGVGVRVVGA